MLYRFMYIIAGVFFISLGVYGYYNMLDDNITIQHIYHIRYTWPSWGILIGLYLLIVGVSKSHK